MCRLSTKKIPKLTNSELWHIRLAHVCPSLILHLYKVAEDIPSFRGLGFKCHCYVEEKMKHAPKAQGSMTQVTHPGQIVSVDTCGPYKVESIHKNICVAVFVDH